MVFLAPPWLVQIPPADPPIPGPKARPRPRPFMIDPSCVFYWDGIDKLSRVKALDESGNGNHGAITNATWVADGLYFSGTGTFVGLGVLSVTSFNTITMSAWIKSVSGGGGGTIISSRQEYRLKVGVNTLGGNFADLSDTTYSDTATDVLDGNWHFIAISWDGVNLIGYYDGVQLTPDPSIGTISTVQVTEIGRRSVDNDTYFNGTIAEVAIFNRGLSAVESNNLYLVGKARLGI